MLTISILGSTGSIGTQALSIVRNRRQELQIKALSAGNNLELLIKQIEEFKPEYACINNPDKQKTLEEIFPKLKVLKSKEELAQVEADVFLSAITGIAGLEANLTALKHCRRVAVANKETLVSAGHLVQEAATKYNSELIPVDSEHVAIHQCLAGNPNSSVKEILLTSSGGPFRTFSQEELEQVSLAQALKHPTWSMGTKITIDSSTLANKGLEVIEAKMLFDIDYDQIRVVIHPQSIVHSAVSFVDGNTVSQLSSPDMMVPIQYALDYPVRKPIKLNQEFDIVASSPLEFYEPDFKKFPALKLAYEAGKLGHSYTAVYNSANEAAVQLFLQEKIHYLDIAKIIEKELEKHKVIKNLELEAILELDKEIKYHSGAI